MLDPINLITLYFYVLPVCKLILPPCSIEKLCIPILLVLLMSFGAGCSGLNNFTRYFICYVLIVNIDTILDALL